MEKEKLPLIDLRAARLAVPSSIRDFCKVSREYAKPGGAYGISPKTLWQIETGRVVPRPSSLAIIGEVLGVDPARISYPKRPC